ncbi:MAG: hypothetical protein KGI54_07650 [Pseudomonadota bacterium]|nr:hypothetical protein [Pseudomonadota bacterium]
MTIDTCWGRRKIHEKPYWHLVSTQPSAGLTFYQNIRVYKGVMPTISALIKAEPHLENAQTHYSYAKINDEKEKLFEKVRQDKYPALPSRLKTIYLFDDYALVERALKDWFENDPRNVHECRILVGSNTHKADTEWLNCHQNEWEQCSHKYWNGIMSPNAFPEVIVDGVIYFPNYTSFPCPSSFLPK